MKGDSFYKPITNKDVDAVRRLFKRLDASGKQTERVNHGERGEKRGTSQTHCYNEYLPVVPLIASAKGIECPDCGHQVIKAPEGVFYCQGCGIVCPDPEEV